MKFSQSEDPEVKINVGKLKTENKTKFRFIEKLINNDGRDQKEIKAKTEITRKSNR